MIPGPSISHNPSGGKNAALPSARLRRQFSTITTRRPHTLNWVMEMSTHRDSNPGLSLGSLRIRQGSSPGSSLDVGPRCEGQTLTVNLCTALPSLHRGHQSRRHQMPAHTHRARAAHPPTPLNPTRVVTRVQPGHWINQYTTSWLYDTNVLYILVWVRHGC